MVKKSKKSMTEEQKKFIDKWLFVLLASNDSEPIRGKTRLIKEFFLIWKRHFNNLGNIAEFYPFHFGPYSTLVATRFNSLYHSGYIEFLPSGIDVKYKLTEKGYILSSNYISEIENKILEDIEDLKSEFSKLSSSKILAKVYRDYPNYAQLSIVSEVAEIKGNIPDVISLRDIVDDGNGFVDTRDFSQNTFEIDEKCLHNFQ